jgi:hypothetical protein
VSAADLGASVQRARTVLWGDVESATLEARYPGRRLTLVTRTGRLEHKYGKLEDEAFLAPLLAVTLGGRFQDNRAENNHA